MSETITASQMIGIIMMKWHLSNWRALIDRDELQAHEPHGKADDRTPLQIIGLHTIMFEHNALFL